MFLIIYKLIVGTIDRFINYRINNINMVVSIKDIKNKQVLAKLRLYKKYAKMHSKLLAVDLRKLSEKKTIELDKESDKVLEKEGLYYSQVVEYLTSNGKSVKESHNFIINYGK